MTAVVDCIEAGITEERVVRYLAGLALPGGVLARNAGLRTYTLARLS